MVLHLANNSRCSVSCIGEPFLLFVCACAFKFACIAKCLEISGTRVECFVARCLATADMSDASSLGVAVRAAGCCSGNSYLNYDALLFVPLCPPCNFPSFNDRYLSDRCTKWLFEALFEALSTRRWDKCSRRSRAAVLLLRVQF